MMLDDVLDFDRTAPLAVLEELVPVVHHWLTMLIAEQHRSPIDDHSEVDEAPLAITDDRAMALELFPQTVLGRFGQLELLDELCDLGLMRWFSLPPTGGDIAKISESFAQPKRLKMGRDCLLEQPFDTRKYIANRRRETKIGP